MDIPTERHLIHSAIDVLLQQADTTRSPREREYLYGLVDRLREAVHDEEARQLIAEEDRLNS